MAKDKKDINKTGLTLGLTLLAVSIACFLLVLISQPFALMLFGSFMHGVDLTQIAMTPVLGWTTLLGFVVSFVGGYLIGIVFAAIHNKLNK